jgi:hypothetical protein
MKSPYVLFILVQFVYKGKSGTFTAEIGFTALNRKQWG